jgi:hypothetical protein
MLSKHNRIYAFSLLLLSLLVFVTGADDSVPHFDKVAFVLQIPDQLITTELSSQGNYIVALARRKDEEASGYIATDLIVWDIGGVEEEGYLINLAPISHRNINPEETFFHHYQPFSISPNEQYVAIRTESDVQLLNLPDLSLYSSLPVRSIYNIYRGALFDNFAWSHDSRFVGTTLGLGEEFVVWDTETNDNYSYDLGYVPIPTSSTSIPKPPNIYAVKNGWIISNFEGNEYPGFVFCDQYLEQCSSYESNRTTWLLYTTDGQTILTFNGINNTANIWAFQTNGTYEIIGEQDMEICPPKSFSPTGQYLFIDCHDDRGDTIWDFNTFTPVHEISDAEFGYDQTDNHVWFTDDTYFIQQPFPYTSLNLYELGQPEPIDELRLPEKGRDYIEYGIVEIDNLAWPQISEDGRTLLVNPGGVAFIIFVEYE